MLRVTLVTIKFRGWQEIKSTAKVCWDWPRAWVVKGWKGEGWGRKRAKCTSARSVGKVGDILPTAVTASWFIWIDSNYEGFVATRYYANLPPQVFIEKLPWGNEYWNDINDDTGTRLHNIYRYTPLEIVVRVVYSRLYGNITSIYSLFHNYIWPTLTFELLSFIDVRRC